MERSPNSQHKMTIRRAFHPSYALIVGLSFATIMFLPLVACGKKGPNKAPGPKSAITSHRVYPAPDE